MAKASRVEARRAKATEEINRKVDLILAHFGIDLNAEEPKAEKASGKPKAEKAKAEETEKKPEEQAESNQA